MRIIGCVALVAGGLALAGLAVGLAESPVESPVKTEETKFDVFSGEQKVGRMRLRTMTLRDIVILEEDFTAAVKGKEMGFDSQVVYKGDASPRPQRAKATTRLGAFKLMDGTIIFDASTAKAEMSGYADKDQKPLEKALQAAKDTPMPEGVVLTCAAFMYFAPRLLPQPGQISKAVYMEFPADVIFPNLLFFNAECILSHSTPTPEGQSEFALKRVFAGGNPVYLAAMTVDKSGKIVEVRLRNFTFRPAGADVPAKPATPKSPPPPK